MFRIKSIKYRTFILPVFIESQVSSSSLHGKICPKGEETNTLELCLTSYEVLGSEPGEDWQVDFTMRPKTSNFQYLPVFIDTSKRWAEASHALQRRPQKSNTCKQNSCRFGAR